MGEWIGNRLEPALMCAAPPEHYTLVRSGTLTHYGLQPHTARNTFDGLVFVGL